MSLAAQPISNSMNGVLCNSGLDVVKKIMAEEIREYLDRKEEFLWRKGQEGMMLLQQESANRVQKTMEMFQKFQETQRALVEDNVQMKKTIADLKQQLDGAERKLVPRSAGEFQDPLAYAPADQHYRGLHSRRKYNSEGYAQTLSPRSWLAVHGDSWTKSYSNGYRQSNDSHSAGSQAPPMWDTSSGADEYENAANGSDLTKRDSAFALALDSLIIDGKMAQIGEKRLDEKRDRRSEIQSDATLCSFEVVLSKESHNCLGLGIGHSNNANTMIVDTIDEDGAVAAWNAKQTAAGGVTIQKGDEIIRVNTAHGGVQHMLEECRQGTKLDMTIHRTTPSRPKFIS